MHAEVKQYDKIQEQIRSINGQMQVLKEEKEALEKQGDTLLPHSIQDGMTLEEAERQVREKLELYQAAERSIFKKYKMSDADKAAAAVTAMEIDRDFDEEKNMQLSPDEIMNMHTS